jgi:hypothetical protein
LLRRRPYWTDVRAISNTSVARLVILIPLIGYWIILNDRIVSGIADLSNVIVPLDEQKPPHMPWRLFATYFGLCLVAAASFIYQACCPREVKTHPGGSSYAGQVAPDLSDIEHQRVLEDLENGDGLSQSRVGVIKHFYSNELRGLSSQGFTEDDRRNSRQEYKRETLQAHFDLCNRRAFPARVMVMGFYASGFFALMVPSVDVFLRVIVVLRRAIWG